MFDKTTCISSPNLKTHLLDYRNTCTNAGFPAMTLNETSLENRFNQVSTSQGSIQSLSVFCLHYKNHHKRIAQIWLRCLQKSKVPHRLTLIYLANDIVQNAKRKNALSFIEDFKTPLKDAVPYLRDEKIKKFVERVFSIWQDRSVYDSKFTTELKNSLNDTEPRIARIDAVKPITNESMTKQISNDLIIDSLKRLASIEKSAEKLKSTKDNVIDRLSLGTFSISHGDTEKNLSDLKSHIVNLRYEIEERNKLAKLLEDSMNNQKRLLKESEDQLSMYKSQFEHVTKLRDDLEALH